MRALSLVPVLLLAGCWDWSFPEELLRRDARPDTRADVAVDTPNKPDRAADRLDLRTKDLPGPDTTSCSPACGVATPICDKGTCRGCRDHSECKGVSTGELCAADGSCPLAENITYVDCTCSGSVHTGDKQQPYCKLADAISPGKKYILVRKGTSCSYGDAAINSSHEIHGEPGTKIAPSACDKLIVQGGSGVTVVLSGFTIQGNVKIAGPAGTGAKLLQNTIGPSDCKGVAAAADTTVTLERNFIIANKGGGIELLDGAFFVKNNIIVQNGVATGPTATDWGGAKLKPSGNHAFINNTVADNAAAGTDANRVGGVRCEAGGATLVNNIFWGNTFNKSATTPTGDRQYSVNCTAEHSLEQLQPGVVEPPSPNTNITTTGTATSIFMGATFPSSSAMDYHIKPGSPAQHAGTKTDAPLDDFDRQPRTDAHPDIGADEYYP